jgi:DNA-binding phage protein
LAKKSLRSPQVPSGVRRDFFIFLQGVALQVGDLSVAKIADRVHYSHQTIYKALTGPEMPSFAVAEAISRGLGGEQARVRAVELWMRAVAEQRGLQRPNMPGGESGQDATVSNSSARLEFRQALAQAIESRSRGVRAVAEELDMARSTVYGYLKGDRLPSGTTARFLDNLFGTNGSLYEIWSRAVKEQVTGGPKP